MKQIMHYAKPLELGKISRREFMGNIVIVVVIMIAHQTIRVTDPVHTLAYITKQPKKRLPIIISFVDILASVTPGRDVIKRPFKLQSNWSAKNGPGSLFYNTWRRTCTTVRLTGICW